MRGRVCAGLALAAAMWFLNMGACGWAGIHTELYASGQGTGGAGAGVTGSEGSDTGNRDLGEADTRDILERFDFSELNEVMEELFPGEGLDFQEVLSEAVKGNLEFSWKIPVQLLKSQMFSVFQNSRKSLAQIFILAIFAAVLQNFSEIFESRQTAQMGYYIVFLLLVALCLHSFQTVSGWIEGGVRKLTLFMAAFCPLYYLAVAIAKGSLSAAAFYHLSLLLIAGVELLIVYVVLPAIHIYMMLRIMDFLSQESYLGKFAELLETAVGWALKALFALVAGIHVVQGMISPAIDAVKRSALTRGIEAVPGVGDAAGGAAEVFLATAVLIKNGMGVVGMLICLAVFLSPLLQVGLAALLYKLAAAALQPVSDKRIVGCVESMGNGCVLLMRVALTAGLLFLLTIAVVAAVTNL